MAVPRTPTGGLKPARPAGGTRSTQRIVLPTPPGARANNQTRSLAAAAASGRINLPIGMILRSLPPQVLAADMAEFEATGAAATEVGLPMNMILGQLPSGKVEMTLQELVPHFPPGYLQPIEAISSYLPTVISLPLMDVVMRIPPDLLALRPDQKDVDASVINMADPFTEEILREQAEQARRQTQGNLQPKIIEESQAPQEEFVPRDQSPVVTVAPPRRPAAEPLAPARTAATTLAAPPMPPVAKLPTPPSGSPRASQPIPVPTPVRSFDTPVSTPVPVPTAPTAPLPPPTPVSASAPDAAVLPPPPSASSTAPVPPVPRHTGRIPAPPPPRHTTGLPLPRRTGSVPVVTPPEPEAQPVAESESQPTPEPAPEPIATESAPAVAATGTPDPNAGELARLAALAMAELGEGSEPKEEKPPEPEAAAPEAAPMAIATQPLSTQPMPPAEPLSTVPLTAPSVRATIPHPEPTLTPVPAVPTASGATPGEEHPAPMVAFNLNTCTVEDLVEHIPGCSKDLAEAIIRHRKKIGSYKRIDDLLDVPGMTKNAYTDLTGEAPPEHRITMTINELLNFPESQNVTLKDVTDRIACWPDVTGCLLSQSSGLSLVGTVPEGVDKQAIVAFAPRMFEALNKSFSEVSGQETDAILIPSAGISYHLFRMEDLYLIIMCRLPQMPERHMKVARLVLAALSARRD